MTRNLIGHCFSGAAVVLALGLAALPALGDVTAPGKAAVAAPPRVEDGFIVSADDAAKCLRDETEPDDFFTPTPSEVKRLESGLARALAAIVARTPRDDWRARRVLPRIGTDHRWYFGVVIGGLRFIMVEGRCPSRERWWPPTPGTCPRQIRDGGSCVWHIRFDLKHGTLDGFDTDGLG